MNRKYQKKGHQAMTLIDFMASKVEKEKEKNSINRSRLGGKAKDEKSFGLSTLLHFNNNDSLSSIRSHKYDRSQLSQMNASQGSRFGILMEDARKQINDLKNKRIQLQQQWKMKNTSFKQTKPWKQPQNQEEQSYISQVLDESEVDIYSGSLDRPVYPKKHGQSSQNDDKFVQELKRNILKGKGEQFILRLKKYAMLRIHIQLKLWTQLSIFKENTIKEHMKRVFHEWKDVTDQTVQRQQLREMILNRLKKRKQLEQINTNVEVYLSDL